MTKICTRAIAVKVSITNVSFKNDIDSNTASIVFVKEGTGSEAGTKYKKLI